MVLASNAFVFDYGWSALDPRQSPLLWRRISMVEVQLASSLPIEYYQYTSELWQDLGEISFSAKVNEGKTTIELTWSFKAGSCQEFIVEKRYLY